MKKFPTMLRKMWTGQEVQEWIDENLEISELEEANSSFHFRHKIDTESMFVLEEEVAELEEWQRKAFQCYPNIDLDIENLTKES